MVDWATELEILGEALRGWMWQVPISVLCVFFAWISGAHVPKEMLLVLLLGVLGSYFIKRLARPRFHDIPEVVDKFKHGSETQALAACKKLLMYVNDEKQGHAHKFVVVRNYIGEALRQRMTSPNVELCRLSTLLTAYCAQHPKNVFTLGHDKVVQRVVQQLTHENAGVVTAACMAMTAFLKNHECCEELSGDKDTIDLIVQLLGHFNFTVCQFACMILAQLCSQMKPALRQHVCQSKAPTKLCELLRAVDNEDLVACACRAAVALTTDPEAEDADDGQTTEQAKVQSSVVEAVVEAGLVDALCGALSSAEGSVTKLRSGCDALANLVSSEAAKEKARKAGVCSSLKVLTNHRNPGVAAAAAKAFRGIGDDK